MQRAMLIELSKFLRELCFPHPPCCKDDQSYYENCQYEDVALLLHGTIQKTFGEANSLPWPPTADDLVMSLDDLLPSDLMRFLTLIISGDADLEKSEKTRYLVLSISQV